MGFETNAAALLLKMRRDGVDFGRVLTLGHQHLHLDPATYRRVQSRLGQPLATEVPVYADGLLAALGAASVEALDASTYEGATRIHDLNEPVPAAWQEQFDLVFDGGTLEHVFNFTAALKNCMQMVKPQGRFVSVTMPNNWCGHGFYQFSPEFFFSLYAEGRGFTGTEVFLVEEHRPRTWYRVRNPAHLGRRVQVVNRERTLVLVMTRKTSRAVMPTR